MTEAPPNPKSKTVHRVAVVLLFLMIAQPTFDNVRALMTGVLVMGDVSAEVTSSNVVLHVIAMVAGWIGFWWFAKRQKRGAYLTIAAHLLGFSAVVTQTPKMLDAMPPAAIAIFFVLMFATALGPIRLFKEDYS